MTWNLSIDEVGRLIKSEFLSDELPLVDENSITLDSLLYSKTEHFDLGIYIKKTILLKNALWIEISFKNSTTTRGLCKKNIWQKIS